MFRAASPVRIKPQALAYLAPEADAIPADCFSRPAADVLAGRTCLIGAANAKPTFVIWGDSHAARAAVAVSDAGRAMHQTGWYAATASCPPLIDVKWTTIGCTAFNQAVMRRIRNDGTTTVILSAFWEFYAAGQQVGDKTFFALTDPQTVTPGRSENARVFRRGLLRTVDALHREGKRVIILGPIPEIGWSVPALLAKAAQSGQPLPSGPTLDAFLSRQASVLETLREAARRPGVTIVYLHPALCTAGGCAIGANGQTFYRDDNHLSNVGVRLIEPTIAASLRDVWTEPPAACVPVAACRK